MGVDRNAHTENGRNKEKKSDRTIGMKARAQKRKTRRAETKVHSCIGILARNGGVEQKKSSKKRESVKKFQKFSNQDRQQQQKIENKN